MKLIYFFRHPSIGHSIHRVFRTLLEGIDTKIEKQTYTVPNRGSMPWDVVKNCIYTLKRRDKQAIHHVTGHIHDVLLALLGTKTVLTIHDLVFIDNVKNPIKRAYKWVFWLYLPIKIADKVICISEQTKRNILKRVTTDKISVLYNPVDPIYVHTPKAFNSTLPRILHIGTGWNKNLENTIRALADIPCELRIIGKVKDHQLALLKKYNIKHTNAINLTDQEIFEEYVNCDIVNFPSKYEGFGMPVIEGQKTGRIVVTSNIEPLREVSGGAAALVNPNSVESIRKAYESVINEEDLREELINKGLENTKRFEVQYLQSQLVEIYKSL